jgi:ribonuclease PH
MRAEGRSADAIRAMKITKDFTRSAAGSVLIETGRTRVLCTASVEDKVPPFLRGKGRGWLTAEYSLLPGSTSPRANREVSRGKASGRTMEIQRLIGRSLRAALDMEALGERTIWIDADVIEADGGTRCASINGGFVALKLALDRLVSDGVLTANPLRRQVIAISAGIVKGKALLDLDYSEDSTAEVDMNVVMDGAGDLIEIQGTGEDGVFNRGQLNEMLDLVVASSSQIRDAQDGARDEN